MENGIWERLSKNVSSRGKKKSFMKGTWQEDKLKIISKYNPYCSIKFERIQFINQKPDHQEQIFCSQLMEGIYMMFAQLPR